MESLTTPILQKHRVLHTALLTLLMFSVFGMGIVLGYFLPQNNAEPVVVLDKKEVKVTTTPTLSPTPTTASSFKTKQEKITLTTMDIPNKSYTLTLTIPTELQIEKSTSTATIAGVPVPNSDSFLIKGKDFAFSFYLPYEADSQNWNKMIKTNISISPSGVIYRFQSNEMKKSLWLYNSSTPSVPSIPLVDGGSCNTETNCGQASISFEVGTNTSFHLTTLCDSASESGLGECENILKGMKTSKS